MWLRATDLNHLGTFPPPGVKVTDILHPAERILVFEQQAPIDGYWNGNVAPGAALRVEPVELGTSPFRELAATTAELKWVRLTNGRLVFGPKYVNASGAQLEIPHTVLSGGADVLAAGEASASVRGSNTVFRYMNNHSGHYEPSNASLDAAINEVVEAGGINVLRRQYFGR